MSIDKEALEKLGITYREADPEDDLPMFFRIKAKDDEKPLTVAFDRPNYATISSEDPKKINDALKLLDKSYKRNVRHVPTIVPDTDQHIRYNPIQLVEALAQGGALINPAQAEILSQTLRELFPEVGANEAGVDTRWAQRATGSGETQIVIPGNRR